MGVNIGKIEQKKMQKNMHFLVFFLKKSRKNTCKGGWGFREKKFKGLTLHQKKYKYPCGG